MKCFYSLVAFLVTFNVFGQTNYKPAEDLIRTNARFWSVPANAYHLNERGPLSALTHKLDSVVSRDAATNATTFRAEMEYNAQGHTTKMRQYDLDSLGALQLSGVFTFEYDIPGYPSYILSEGLDEETQELEPVLEMDITYDGSDRVDSIIISLEDPLFGGGFGPFLSVKQVYNGELLVQTRQWIFIALFGGWLPASITDIQYDDNGLVIDRLTSVVDISTGEILPSDRTSYEYTAEGLEETVTSYTWVEPSWEPTQQFNYEYYSNGTLSSETELFYSNGAWENLLWTLFPVENVTDEFPSSTYSWDAISGEWVVSDSTISILNPALPWANVAAPTQLSILSVLGGEEDIEFFNTEGSSIDETKFFYVDLLTGELSHDYSDFFYYSLLEGSAVSDVLPEYLTITPNPAQDQFVIDLDPNTNATYTVYTTSGATVESGKISQGKNTVQTGGWMSGLYFVTIRLQDGSVFVHKQIVE